MYAAAFGWVRGFRVRGVGVALDVSSLLCGTAGAHMHTGLHCLFIQPLHHAQPTPFCAHIGVPTTKEPGNCKWVDHLPILLSHGDVFATRRCCAAHNARRHQFESRRGGYAARTGFSPSATSAERRGAQSLRAGRTQGICYCDRIRHAPRAKGLAVTEYSSATRGRSCSASCVGREGVKRPNARLCLH